ncbi:uncharacterized protein TRAVEDRAFT_49524 [Trametes versicolor FP-101664 SS1]|uniref:uncharacterized protein n=1 Tax=Trametes versicolor (strain FP-101664) TaxID=717944 RepID=UPI0004623C6E|nr:uncharacterized protein TRAVEDRAFT_49524 [Trametes versicolor FP-101664 SS1]EIW56705.1 hypothetical protein TRAVEDRAFT_49524 [Trametes versicolor FP-101664 SS1]
MAPIRNHTTPPADASSKPEPNTAGVVVYSARLMEMRGRLRGLMGGDLKSRAGPRIKMKWTAVEYANGVVVKGGHRLVGWPNRANEEPHDPNGPPLDPLDTIPFGNLSDIPGGQAVIQRLLDLWTSGKMYFERADEAFIDLAKRNPKAVMPGKPPVRPAPKCWGRQSRDDIGKARGRPASGINPKTGRPYRRRKDGPKTPKMILDSDIDLADEVESDIGSE